MTHYHAEVDSVFDGVKYKIDPDGNTVHIYVEGEIGWGFEQLVEHFISEGAYHPKEAAEIADTLDRENIKVVASLPPSDVEELIGKLTKAVYEFEKSDRCTAPLESEGNENHE